MTAKITSHPALVTNTLSDLEILLGMAACRSVAAEEGEAQKRWNSLLWWSFLQWVHRRDPILADLAAQTGVTRTLYETMALLAEQEEYPSGKGTFGLRRYLGAHRAAQPIYEVKQMARRLLPGVLTPELLEKPRLAAQRLHKALAPLREIAPQGA